MYSVDAERKSIAASLMRAMEGLRPVSDSSRLEAELLLVHTLGCTRASLFAHPERQLSPNELIRFEKLLNRRARGEPLPYLTGRMEFCGLAFIADRRVLIPRPETEMLVELALAVTPSFSAFQEQTGKPSAETMHPVIADIGTGSGCIAIALALQLPHARLFATDISAEALIVARTNAERHSVIDRITFIQSDLLNELPGPVDMIVANLPYISRGEWPALPREVREYEPRLALDGGTDGLGLIQRLLRQAPAHLHPGGMALLEIGATQAGAASHLARQAFPNASITTHSDLNGQDRILSIKIKQEGSDCDSKTGSYGLTQASGISSGRL